MATHADMSSFEQLMKAQLSTGKIIESIIRNYKKDSAVRKTVGYYEERLKKLDTAWSEFEATDNKIRCLEPIPLDHEYFSNNYYNNISELVIQFKELFETALMGLSKEVPRESAQPQPSNYNASKATNNIESDIKQPAAPTAITSAIRRQTVMMDSLQRLLTMDPTTDNMKLKEKLWEQIQNLHFSIWENNQDPLKEGYDMTAYTNLESKVIENFRKAYKPSADLDTTHELTNSLPLPRISIPKFNGDYLKWKTFQDLFCQLVANQKLPTAQKMWYLKSNLGGEAEKLISHLSATAENYVTAWNLLQERYNNKRVIVTTLIQQLLEQPISGSSVAGLKQLHDTTQECLHALNNIGIDTASWDPMLNHVLLKKLDRSTHVLYERTITNPKEVQKTSDLLTFLERHFQSTEAIHHKERPSKVYVSAASFKENETSCTFCKNGSHRLYRCQKFLQLSPAHRLNFIQRQNLCVNCLKSGHKTKTCSSGSCMKCKKKHNSLLHLEGTNKPSKQGSTSENALTAETASHNIIKSNVSAVSTSPDAISLAAENEQPSNSYVFLSTAIVRIKTDTTEVECRALLDSGSQVNLITDRLVKRLNIPKQGSSMNIHGIGKSNTKAQHRVNVALESRINGFSTRLEALVLPRIVAPQPSQHIDIDEWPLPKNLTLADPAFNRPNKIDILLGAEHYHQLLTIGQIQLSKQLPILQNTVFGWIVAGKVHKKHVANASCGICTTDENLESSIARLWELDEVNTNKKPLTIAERQCEEHFSQHTFKTHQNHFVVRIPFHQNPIALGDSHGIALNRFLAIERRLEKNPELKAKYTEFMDEYESLGHMTKLETKSIISPNYFIPHHCVLKPESSTTKLRVVFDASAKTSSGHSLNDLMYTGPTIQSELFSILLRFRMPRFVFTTDIEKMYRQVLVAPEDRHFQLIIWRKDATKPITYYQLNTVTYGTKAAPYLAIKCLHQLAKENDISYPLASQFIKQNFYVDDGLGGSDSLKATIKLQEELVEVMRKGGFTLRKWCANHPQLLHNIPQGDLEVNLDFESTKDDTVKTLGLVWLPKDDKLGVKVNTDDTKRITKRTVTSDLARLFDPLGILSPILVTAKIFIQELWELKLDWDQSLPESLHTKWIAFRSDLNILKTLQVPRHIFKGRVPETLQLHIFTDASEKAYGAAAYIRSVFKDGTIMAHLLCAKSRVAPLKRQTIPRLELCAAVLGAQLAARIRSDLQFASPIWLWTDSEIVLSWINSSSASFNTFVANRISIIQEETKAEQWRHVSSKCNPADVLSRGMSPRPFKECILWFYGPSFLHGVEDIWPPKFNSGLKIPTNLERKTKLLESLAMTTPEPTFIYKINHKNSFHRLQRIVGYVLRFITHIRCKRQLRQSSKQLTTTELSQALVPIVSQMQLSEFKEEIKQLKNYKKLQGTSSIQNLTPFLDENDLIRVGGRLDASSLSYDSKHQLLIPYNDPISKLIFQMIHEDNKHCGIHTLLGIVRQRFWPIKGKIMARSTVHRCTICSRAKPDLFKQIMGTLPSTRVTPARAFINTGVDYCGPITVHYKLRGKRPHKAYIAVFCCFATKAVHLELVSDLTTEAFIGALKRFISRRGHCQNLYCDNATNFVGAKNKLPELLTIIHSSDAQEALTNVCNKKGIQFNFIPPKAPHFGGLWEAAVKSAKYLLIRTLGNASLTYEELETIVVEVEAILNSRPISPMSNDPNDIGALTPGHFLIGEPLTAQIDAQTKPTNLKLETRWKLVSRLKHEFWNRWSRDYLNELQYRNKWRETSRNLEPGAIVIIKEDNVPVMKWPLGRVIKTYKGNDQIVRVADVQTASGVFKRAIHYLAPLPKIIDEPEEDRQQQPTESKHNDELLINNQLSEALPDGKPIAKKQRISAGPSTNITVLLTILLILPLVSANKIEITEFQPNIGIHFEGLGKTRVSRSEWNIISYYNLKLYWREITTLMNETTALNDVCDLLKQKTNCKSVLQTVEFSIAELRDNNFLLKGRIKRGAINVVGNVANSLFGILDSNYAEQMSNTINAVRENENHLKQLLINQTSIIDTTLNVFKQDERNIKQKFNNIDGKLTEFASKLHETETDQHQSKLFQIFISHSVKLSITLARLHRIQAEIITALTDSHHGKISPMLLSPLQLQTELVQVRNHLPSSLDLPVSKDNILQLYKIMNVKGGLTRDYVIFQISIPLSDPEPYELLKPHPIPALVNDTMLAIRPCGDILAVNAHKDQYFVLTEKQWTSCTILEEDEFLCLHMQSKFNANAEKCLCELTLLNHNIRTNCSIVPVADSTTLTQLEYSNQWLYTMKQTTRASVVCGQENSWLNLKGSGLLRIEPDCTLKFDSIVIRGHLTVSTSLQSSYTATTNMSDIIYPDEVQAEKFHIKSFADQIRNISAIQSKLHQQVSLDFPAQIKHTQYHHGTVAYVALIIAIVISAKIAWKKVRCRRIEQNQQTPRPAERRNIPQPEFVVSVA